MTSYCLTSVPWCCCASWLKMTLIVLKPTKLAEKSASQVALSLALGDLVGIWLCQVQPQIHVFSPIKGGIKTAVPFAAAEPNTAKRAKEPAMASAKRAK